MNEFKVICPICKNKIIGKSYHDEYGTYEQYTNCSICGYSYEILYGNEIEIVGNKRIVSFYKDNTNWNKLCLLGRKSKNATYTARRRWKKYRKGVTYDYSKQ